MKKLKPLEEKFWNDYLARLPENKRHLSPFIEVSFAGKREGTDDLIQLYLEGKKHAGSSLVKDFESAGDPLPKVGNYWIILDSNEAPRCLVKTVRVEINIFRDIPAEIAKAEGEGDLSVAYWKRVHMSFYLPFLSQWGIDDIDQAQVITEYFELVHKA